MKLHFEPNLDFQLQAVEAVCDLFRGQETCRTEFTVTLDADDPQRVNGSHRLNDFKRNPQLFTEDLRNA